MAVQRTYRDVNPSALTARLLYLFQSGIGADLDIVVLADPNDASPDAPRLCFRAHKCILMTASEAMRTLIEAGTTSTPPTGSSASALFLEDMPAAALAPTLQFIYTGEATLSPDMGVSVALAAERFGLYNLRGMAERFLPAVVDFDNVCSFLQDAVRHHNAALAGYLAAFIARHFEAVSLTYGFLTLPPPLLYALLHNSSIVVEGEECVFAALLRWGLYNLPSMRAARDALAGYAPFTTNAIQPTTTTHVAAGADMVRAGTQLRALRELSSVERFVLEERPDTITELRSVLAPLIAGIRFDFMAPERLHHGVAPLVASRDLIMSALFAKVGVSAAAGSPAIPAPAVQQQQQAPVKEYSAYKFYEEAGIHPSAVEAVAVGMGRRAAPQSLAYSSSRGAPLSMLDAPTYSEFTTADSTAAARGYLQATSTPLMLPAPSVANVLSNAAFSALAGGASLDTHVARKYADLDLDSSHHAFITATRAPAGQDEELIIVNGVAAPASASARALQLASNTAYALYDKRTAKDSAISTDIRQQLALRPASVRFDSLPGTFAIACNSGRTFISTASSHAQQAAKETAALSARARLAARTGAHTSANTTAGFTAPILPAIRLPKAVLGGGEGSVWTRMGSSGDVKRGSGTAVSAPAALPDGMLMVPAGRWSWCSVIERATTLLDSFGDVVTPVAAAAASVTSDASTMAMSHNGVRVVLNDTLLASMRATGMGAAADDSGVARGILSSTTGLPAAASVPFEIAVALIPAAPAALTPSGSNPEVLDVFWMVTNRGHVFARVVEDEPSLTPVSATTMRLNGDAPSSAPESSSSSGAPTLQLVAHGLVFGASSCITLSVDTTAGHVGVSICNTRPVHADTANSVVMDAANSGGSMNAPPISDVHAPIPAWLPFEMPADVVVTSQPSLASALAAAPLVNKASTYSAYGVPVAVLHACDPSLGAGGATHACVLQLPLSTVVMRMAGARGTPSALQMAIICRDAEGAMVTLLPTRP